MKLFLKKISLLLSILFSILCLITITNKLLFKHFNPFILDNNINILILGDSHTKYAFNDVVMKNTLNLSQDSDSYFYSYQKLKNIVRLNNQIDTVLLSFASHNINKKIEDRWLLNSSHMKKRLILYFPLLEIEDYIFLIEKKPMDLANGLFSQALFPAFLWKGLKAYGGYQDLKHNILISEIEKNKKEKSDIFTESSIEKDYLKKIVEYCDSRNIFLILVNTPLHKSIKYNQEELYLFYNNYFSNIIFYDFGRMTMENSYFGDLVHLSPSGAFYFTDWFEKEQLLKLDKAHLHKFVYKQ